MKAFVATSALPILLVWSAIAAAGEARVGHDGRTVILQNEKLQITFDCSSERPLATRLLNRLSGRTIKLAGDDFSIAIEGRKPLTVADFQLQATRDEPTGAGRRLIFQLSGPKAELRLVYELGDTDHFLRRRLELSSSEPLALREVEVWRLGIQGAAAYQGYGEPVFLEDTFWGLEFPGAWNRHAGDRLTLTHHPGRTAAQLTSKTAVAGIAEKGRVDRRFLDYVASFQVTPKDLGLFVNYNTWWTLMPPTEKNCLELIELFKKKLFQPHGESIDTFTIDEGWDNKETIWAIRTDRFPRGFTPLVERLRTISARFGLWLSPSSGYRHAPWGAANGYELNSGGGTLCQSGPKYRRAIVPVVTGLASKYNIAFFKFDGFSASCEAEGHGHLKGDFGREANIDAFIELLEAARAARPGVYLDPTCGIWLSPWWLRYADSLWGSVSGDYPSLVVPAPTVRPSATTTRDGVFRKRCQEHPGFPPAAIEHLGIIVITPEPWEDNAMIVLGRGSRLLTLYIDPKFFAKGDADWAFLGSILRWARHNAATLQNTQLILGDPLRREPYGYAHFRGPRGVLALRNPFIEPKTVQIKLDESSGWAAGEARSADYCVRVVYPRWESLPRTYRYGDTLSLELAAYETLIVEVEPLVPGEPVVLGVRARPIERRGNRITYELFGPPAKVELAGVSGSVRAEIDGRPAAVAQSTGPRGDAPQVAGGALAVQTDGSVWKLAGNCALTVPAGVQARVHVLCDLREMKARTLRCAATVNGQPTKVSVLRQPERQHDVHTGRLWTWFQFEIPAGRSRVAVTIDDPAGGNRLARGEAGWWLATERRLEKHVLTLEFPRDLGPVADEPLPLPFMMDRLGEVHAIRRPEPFQAGTRWLDRRQKVVRLEQVEPDDFEQPWGRPVTNRSVWDKPMVIAGRAFQRGLGTHAEGRVVYDLSGGDFRRFRATVGRDEHAGDGRVVFEVWLDGKQIFTSGPMTKRTPARPLDVSVEGGKLLELRTLDGGDGISGDHADWAEGELLRD